MNEVTHTPGPWIATGWHRLVVNDAQGNTLCMAPGAHCALPVVEANARLIAAAPDLLAAARRIDKALCQGRYPELQGAAQDLSLAIAKATSRTD